jgi:glycosyltransferase involved in cell wall biosynthesis
MTRKYFIDVCTLFDDFYTGIANVNYFVVKYFFNNLYDECEFFHHDKIVYKKYIAELLEKKQGGEWIRRLERNEAIYIGKVSEFVKSGYSVGIFSHVKYARNVFDYEVQVVHDITYILTEEFHHSETTNYHLKYALDDFVSNDLNVCNSQSTMEDIITYMGVDKDKTIVSLLGMDQEDNNKKLYRDLLKKYIPEDFILILGTIEPRKNIDVVLSYIERNPEILIKYKFVFVGRNGWGETFEDKFKQLDIAENLKENILHLGFISHDLKVMLLKAAKLLIYPSVYEGFGLPVLEAISNATPVLTTISSSIPEVGGNVSYYFDPYSLDDFERSFKEVISDIENEFIDSSELLAHANAYTWEAFVERIIARVNNDLQEKELVFC